MYNVLLVSNQALMRTVLRKIIEKNSNFNVIAESNTPREAISILKNKNINLVFADYIMPKMNGLKFMKSVEEQYTNVKVFLIGFSSEFFSIEENIDLNKIILKPITLEKIDEKLLRYEQFRTESHSDYFISQMQENVNMQDFVQVYEYLVQYFKNISKNDDKNSNIIQMKYDLKDIGIKILNLIGLLDGVEIIDKKFPISDFIASDIRLCNIWIFKLVEFCFKIKSIRTYPILKRVFKYLDENINKNISLHDVVDSCNISQGYLSRLFRSEYNITVVNYIHLNKVNIAKEYILMENKSVSDIAFDLGYNEYGYFSKVFKQYEHETIEKFRKGR